MRKIVFSVVSAVCFLAISVCALATIPTNPIIPDTGQTQSYTETFGEDHDYTINPPSYTKLNELGNVLPDDATEWSMVKDNVTGLIWEIKTDDGSIHDKDNTYNWDNAQNVFIAELNTGNFNDWRLPTIKELSSIIKSGIYNPAINTNYFPNTISDDYWSSTANVQFTSPARAWYVDFNWGIVFGDTLKSDLNLVRAVRGEQQQPNSFTDNGDGTVTDTSTGLMWQQTTAGPMTTWEAALIYCESLSLGEYDDWRLPNRNELQSIVDYTRYNPATTFPDTETAAKPYWSSTTFVYGFSSDSAYCAHFYNGIVTFYAKSQIDPYAPYVRAVRSGNLAVEIPDRCILSGELFTCFDADDCVTGGTPPWTWTWVGDVNLIVTKDEDNVFSITYPADWTGEEIITFTATGADGISKNEAATFTVDPVPPNQLPDCSQTYSSPNCLWPPNHQMVPVSILGVTDPDNDPVTITITGITSDEPTASDKGSGGAKYAPDASGVGTDTAKIRSERSGNGDGRVYVINFTANDGEGGECIGSVKVNAPHDQSSDCLAIDSGQDYDATQIN